MIFFENSRNYPENILNSICNLKELCTNAYLILNIISKFWYALCKSSLTFVT